MTDQELRDIFKYKKFRLSSDGSIVYFELSSVRKNGMYIGEYTVKVESGKFIMTFDPATIGPFLNVCVITECGNNILLNPLTSKFKSGQTIVLERIPKEDVPDDIKVTERSDEL